jgi:integrase
MEPILDCKSDTVRMSKAKPKQEPDASDSSWQKSPHANLVRYIPSGVYFARIRIGGKLIRKSLKTDVLSVAKLRLNDLEEAERRNVTGGDLESKSRVTVDDAIEAYRQNGFRPAEPKNPKEAKRLKPAALAYYEERVAGLLRSWPGLGQTEIRKLTERDCRKWADRYRQEISATVFNHTLGILRNLVEFGIKSGARYDNPAIKVMRESEKPKTLELPTSTMFAKLVVEIEQGGSGKSKPCAELVQFLAFGGFRKGEAAYVTWGDCDFGRGCITVRGHPETGLKNRPPGEIRTIQMIPDMRRLLGKMRQERSNEPPTAFVMRVRECQKAINSACNKLGLIRFTHHDLRHLFATRCIESGVDIPTVSRWLGHRDGGALAMRVYGHLRDQHSAEMAGKVSFGNPTSSEPASNPDHN